MVPDHSWLALATVFAGPTATVIAAGAAVIVTHRLGTRQVKIAEDQAKTAAAQSATASAQRDIAFDRLKYDLFQQRYSIYATAKQLIEKISGRGFEQGIYDRSLREMRVKLDEARFFFPDRETKLFSQIETLAAEHEVARVGMETEKDDALRMKAGETAAKKLIELVRIYELLTPAMEAELGFNQLTRKQ